MEELRIGALEGDEAYTFGRVTGLVVDRDGIIWIADALNATIRRFRPDGSHLDNIGRKGDGPGEFDGGYGISLAQLPDGRVLTFDPLRRPNALSLFSSDGNYLGGLRVDLGGIVSGGFHLRLDTTGVIHVRSVRITANPAVSAAGAPPTQGLWLRVTPEGRLLDTLFMPLADRVSEGGRGYPFGTMSPFTYRTMSALSPHGYLVAARNDRYAIHRPLRDGRVVRIERSWDPLRVSQEERARRESAPISPIMPAMEWWEPLVTDVIEPNGRFLGTVRFPNLMTTLAATADDVLWVIERGEFDEDYVVRYRIVPG